MLANIFHDSGAWRETLLPRQWYVLLDNTDNTTTENPDESTTSNADESVTTTGDPIQEEDLYILSDVMVHISRGKNFMQ